MTDKTEFAEDTEDQPEDQLRHDIAQYMAALSEASDTPTEFSTAGAAFDSAAVDFESGTWIARLVDIQGWLRFDGDDLIVAPADTFVPALVDALGLDHAEAIDSGGTSPTLSLTGLNRLYERLALAAQHQNLFITKFEDSAETRASATEAWIDAWGESAGEEDPEDLRPVHAVADTWPISEFTGRKLNLNPSYQRGDVWGSPARQSLIESILRGIPLPSVILLKHQDLGKPHEVVDGKQRLTAIFRFIGMHPLAVDRVKEADARHGLNGALSAAFQEDYLLFKRMWRKWEGVSLSAKMEEDFYFPFKLRSGTAAGLTGSLEKMRGKYYTQIKDMPVEAAEDRVQVKELFTLRPSYKIPVIVYRKADQRQIHEVFKLYNKQGMHLNAEELRNAVYHDLELTRALLIAAGDSELGDIDEIAPALKPVREEVSGLGEMLSSYDIGTSRYRRTKILSWLVAVLLGDTKGKPLPSTARHIDNLLTSVKKEPTNPLNKPGTLADLFRWIAASMKVHAELKEEMWAPAFRDTTGRQGWQELQLVGSLIGIAMLCAVDPDGAPRRAADACDDIFEASATAALGDRESPWARPAKTQTKQQWQYIARIAQQTTDLLGVDPGEAAQKIRRTYGDSGIESLLADTGDAG